MRRFSPRGSGSATIGPVKKRSPRFVRRKLVTAVRKAAKKGSTVGMVVISLGAAQRAQVALLSVLPDKRPQLRRAGPGKPAESGHECARPRVVDVVERTSNDLAEVVEGHGGALGSAKSAEVGDLAVLPDDGMSDRIAGPRGVLRVAGKRLFGEAENLLPDSARQIRSCQ